MTATKTFTPTLRVRKGVLIAIAVCLFFHCILFSGYLDFVWPRFLSGEALFAGGVAAETLIVFFIFYWTPLFALKAGPCAGVGRVVVLVLIAHCFVWGVMLAEMIFWFVACAILGIPARNG